MVPRAGRRGGRTLPRTRAPRQRDHPSRRLAPSSSLALALAPPALPSTPAHRRRGSAKAKAQARRKRFSTHELQLSQSFSSRAATNSLTANSEQFWQTQPAKFQLAV